MLHLVVGKNYDCAFTLNLVTQHWFVGFELLFGMSDTEGYDFIIVGAGAAGCVVAEKLSRQARVLLLEAGGSDTVDAKIQEHDSWWEVAHAGQEFNWTFATEKLEHLGGRAIPMEAGKMLGGSGSHNAMFYVRGNWYDWEHFQEATDAKWNRDAWENAFVSLEKTEIQSKYHGNSGHMHVERALPTPLFESFKKGADSLGIPYLEDYNAERQLGFGLVWNNITPNDHFRHSPYRVILYIHLFLYFFYFFFGIFTKLNDHRLLSNPTRTEKHWKYEPKQK